MFARMINYLYNLDYADDPANLTDEDGKDHTASSLEVNVHMFALGDKYDIPDLRKLAISKFEKCTQSSWAAKDFAAAMKLTYEKTVTSVPDGWLRDYIIQLSVDFSGALIKDSAFNAAVLQVAEFGRDMMARLAQDEHECSHCHEKWFAVHGKYCSYCGKRSPGTP